MGASLVPVTSNNLFLFCFLYKNLQQSDILVLRVSWCRCWVWGLGRGPWGPSPAQGGGAHWAPPAPQLPSSPSPGQEGAGLGSAPLALQPGDGLGGRGAVLLVWGFVRRLWPWAAGARCARGRAERHAAPHSRPWAHGWGPESASSRGSAGWAGGGRAFLPGLPGLWGSLRCAAGRGGAGRPPQEWPWEGRRSRCGQEPQVRFLCLCHRWLGEVGPQHLCWGDSCPPRPLRYLALGESGARLCWGVFPGHPPKSTDGPQCGNPARRVGGGGVLDNLMFSTLTPFFVFKVGVGLLPKRAGGLDPSLLPPSLLPGERQWQAGLQGLD